MYFFLFSRIVFLAFFPFPCLFLLNFSIFKKKYQDKLNLQNKLLSLQNEHDQKLRELSQKNQYSESLLQNANLEFQNLVLQLEDIKNQLIQSEQIGVDQLQKVKQLEISLDSQKEKVKEFDQKLIRDEQTRKKLHNTIQELKGNIRVFCRIRPFLRDETIQDQTHQFSTPIGSTNVLNIISPESQGVTGKIEKGKNFSFTFDKIFHQDATQGLLFFFF